MHVGIVVPQGWMREYRGWRPADAWRRSVAVAQQADRLGFESIWLFDHFQTAPRPTDDLTFEAFTGLSRCGGDPRVRLGTNRPGYRNPALWRRW
jgi:alkanesulfonate monooxygenase SsuD/methylene tetrahydromethanopterin reductase-like flavin-dependent oxidoreductase (luciferase family)